MFENSLKDAVDQRVQELSTKVCACVCICVFCPLVCWIIFAMQGPVYIGNENQASYLYQTYVLTKRTFINNLRNIGDYFPFQDQTRC